MGGPYIYLIRGRRVRIERITHRVLDIDVINELFGMKYTPDMRITIEKLANDLYQDYDSHREVIQIVKNVRGQERKYEIVEEDNAGELDEEIKPVEKENNIDSRVDKFEKIYEEIKKATMDEINGYISSDKYSNLEEHMKDAVVEVILNVLIARVVKGVLRPARYRQ